MADISANIKKQRVLRGMSQAQLAERAGVARQTISSWERGASFPDIHMVERLAEVLGVGVDELLFPQPAEKKRRKTAKPISGTFVLISMFFYGLLLAAVWLISREPAALLFWGLILLAGFIALCTCLLSACFAESTEEENAEQKEE